MAVKKIPISVVVLAKNEAGNIERCVGALDWSDDVVVVDDHSTDGTAELARRMGARVLNHSFQSFAHQRNWAMHNAELKYDWVLHLDADEVSTVDFRDCVAEAIKNADDGTVAFRVCRKTILRGKWLRWSDGFPVWIMRIVKRGCVEFQDQGHGEVAVPRVNGVMGTIKQPFEHFAFSKGLANWIDRHNKYSTREALLEIEQEQIRNSRQVGPTSRRDGEQSATTRAQWRALSRRLPCRHLLRFAYQYLFRLGFLDGRAGWEFCSLMATYESWIVMKKREQREGRQSLGR